MDYKIISLILALMILSWQIMLWKKVELPKWIDYTMSAITVLFLGWYVYLTFL